MRFVPTRRLALVAAVVGLVALVLPGAGLLWPLVALDLLLIIVAVADAVAAVDPMRLAVQRDLPPVLVLGSAGEVTWTIGNPTERRLRIALADQLAPSLNASTRRLVASVPAGARLVGSTELRPSRRGRFDIVDLVIRVDGPLGLGSRQRTLRKPAVLQVHPLFASRDQAELRINRARVLEVGLRSARGRGGGTEFDQLREYGVDDEIRRIDWAATARSGKAMVRTYRAERNQTVLAMLDNGRVMAGRVAEVPRVEHAMDALMCLTTVATRLGDRCGLVVFDRDVRSVLPPRAGRDQLGRVAEAMYALDPVLAESDYRGAFAQVMARFRRRALIVLFTDLVEQAVGESLLPALPLLVRHHVVVIVAVRDPDVTGWTTSVPQDGAGAYRAAAATAALADRDRTVARLRGLGAVVIDAPPDHVAAKLADAYLDLKARGSL
ncbi:MAG: DUF58 domain-containing protein [Acidimicrobiales bacterium]